MPIDMLSAQLHTSRCRSGLTAVSKARRSNARTRYIVAYQPDSKPAQVAQQHIPSSHDNSTTWTTNTGAPVSNNNQSLTAGVRGPVLLEDAYLTEKLANFHRERIPERVVHARGATAKGYFEVTHDITKYTSADLFKEVGLKTPVLTRFSTVVHERGSPETLRDIRGFSVKFYTQQGNWDLVGNDIPVFFIRDGMKFPDMVHALKPNPKSNLQEGWRIMDFFSNFPESVHTFAYLLDDTGIPYNYRRMPGFGVHTYKLINKDGKETYVKFHWRPNEGERWMTEQEKHDIGGANHSHATEDLYNSIKEGNFPEWSFHIQTMEIEDEDKFDFDPLDPTKIWPEEQFPLQPVGRMVLDRNIDNFFLENEQVAFAPSTIVPGIAFSDDKLLQSRVFSYADAQRYRVGSNYLQLPANAPKCPFHNNNYDGAMNFMHRDEEVNYFPSRYDDGREAMPGVPPKTQQEYNHVKREQKVIGKENNFKQAGDRYRSWDSERQQRYIHNLVKWLAEPKVLSGVRSAWIQFQGAMDEELGKKLEAALKEKGLETEGVKRRS